MLKFQPVFSVHPPLGGDQGGTGRRSKGPGNGLPVCVVCWALDLGVYSSQVPAVSFFETSSMPPIPAVRPVRF